MRPSERQNPHEANRPDDFRSLLLTRLFRAHIEGALHFLERIKLAIERRMSVALGRIIANGNIEADAFGIVRGDIDQPVRPLPKINCECDGARRVTAPAFISSPNPVNHGSPETPSGRNAAME